MLYSGADAAVRVGLCRKNGRSDKGGRLRGLRPVGGGCAGCDPGDPLLFYNFVGERIDGYEQPCALITKEAAEALKAVSDDVMAQGYRLKVFDAYRPQMAVDHFVRWAEDLNATEMKPYFYPEVDKSLLFEQGYIDAKSGHSRGSTIDLTLFDMATGKEVDMGGTFDYFGELSHPDYTATLTEEQIANRNLLRDAMLRHGFKPLDTEWWHFTLLDEPYPDTYFTFKVSADSVGK